jgi:hypothetical protein
MNVIPSVARDRCGSCGTRIRLFRTTRATQVPRYARDDMPEGSP